MNLLYKLFKWIKVTLSKEPDYIGCLRCGRKFYFPINLANPQCTYDHCALVLLRERWEEAMQNYLPTQLPLPPNYDTPVSQEVFGPLWPDGHPDGWHVE